MTTMANLNDLIPTEEIEAAMGPHLPPPTALAMASSRAVGKGSGNNVQIPRFDSVILTPAGNKVENDEFPLVATTTSRTNIAGGWVGYSDHVSWESDKHSLVDAVLAVITRGVIDIRNRVDRDGLAQLANATTDANFTGQPLTDDRVLTALATFETLNPHDTPGGRGIALTPGQVLDWVQDLKVNGGEQLSGDAESERLAKIMGARQGFVGVRHALQIFKSNNVSLTGADANGAIVQMGEGGALAYRSWNPIMWESEWRPRRKAWEVTISANYGYGLPSPNNLIGVISLAV